MLMRTSGLYKLMGMKLENEFLDSLQIKAETLQRNQSVRNLDNELQVSG